MKPESICVIATIQVPAAKREEFLEEFRRIVPKVRQENGCLEYTPWIDLDTSLPAQAEVRGDTVVVVERWESVEALETHFVAPHMLEYRKRVRELVQSVNLQIMRPVSL